MEPWRSIIGIFRPLCCGFCRGGRNTSSSPELSGELHNPNSTEPRTAAGMLFREITPESEPYNFNYLTLGTALLWFGWAGFNGGSALAGNLRASSAWFSTHIAACAGGTTSIFLMWINKWTSGDHGPQLSRTDSGASVNNQEPSGSRHGEHLGETSHISRDPVQGVQGRQEVEEEQRIEAEKRDRCRRQQFHNQTVLYFCEGAMVGLVAITPGAGYASRPRPHQWHDYD